MTANVSSRAAINTPSKIVWLSALIGVCQSCAPSNTPIEITLPRGAYTAEGPFCESSGQRPHYPKVEYAAALFDFDEVSHTLVRNSPSDPTFVEEVFSSETCQLTVGKGALTTVEGLFGTGLSRSFQWNPAGCTLSLSSLNSTMMVGSGYSELFNNSSDGGADLLYEVIASEETENSYTLKTVNAEPYLSAWEDFGCLEEDRIVYELTKQSQ